MIHFLTDRQARKEFVSLSVRLRCYVHTNSCVCKVISALNCSAVIVLQRCLNKAWPPSKYIYVISRYTYIHICYVLSVYCTYAVYGSTSPLTGVESLWEWRWTRDENEDGHVMRMKIDTWWEWRWTRDENEDGRVMRMKIDTWWEWRLTRVREGWDVGSTHKSIRRFLICWWDPVTFFAQKE